MKTKLGGHRFLEAMKHYITIRFNSIHIALTFSDIRLL